MTRIMNDAEWERYRNYADQVVIAVIPIDTPMDQDEADEEWLAISPGAGWSQEWLVREVESIALDFQQDGQPMPADHILKVRENRFSWGADAATTEILLWITSWAATSASWDLLKALTLRMSGKLSEETSEPDRPLTADEVEGRARWIVQARFDEEMGSLELLAVETRDDGASVTLRSPNSGWTFEVDLALDQGIVAIARVKKRR